MEPTNNENKQNVPEGVIEKKSWITPEMEVHDIVEMTQSGRFGIIDFAFSYS